MLNKRVRISALAMFLLLSAGAVQAAKPEANVAGKAEHSESFWDRWFGRAEKVQRTDADDRVEAKKVKEKKSEHQQKSERNFSNSERSHIEDYYRADVAKRSNKKDKKKQKNKSKNMPYGLQKKLERGGQLPPGWQTKVARGEVLDADILRHSERIPYELERRLPALRDGEEIRRVGDKVVRVLEGNGTVIDVIDLADIILR
ncbi:MAG: hypothetical protein AB1Y26_12175 [Cycloclasticus sp.]|nr:hypothetical protein A9Q85_00880 [Cycloclasticus sp. 44_32_T64]